MQEFIEQIKESLVGKKIVTMRYMTDEEMKKFSWFKRPIVILLDDGTVIIPFMDDEGNDGGAMAVINKEFNLIPTL
jgi:hypothetical protein